jgi:GTP-binding protein
MSFALHHKEILLKGFEYFQSLYSKTAVENYSKYFDLPHIAFFGASNAGKSSLISSLCGVKHLSFSSKKPGKTKEILLFTSKHPFFHKKSFFVDFPGYGYAKVANSTLEQWEAIPEFINHVNIQKSYILIPVQKGISDNDIQMINFLMRKQFSIILTKCEKTPIEAIVTMQTQITKTLQNYRNFTGQVFVTSAKSAKEMQNAEIVQEIFDIFKRYINGI